MSAAFKNRLRRRGGLEDVYLSSLPANTSRSRGTDVPPKVQSAFSLARTLHQRVMPDVFVYQHEHIIDLGAIRETIAYTVWWIVWIERRQS